MIDAATMIEEILATGVAAQFRASGDSMYPAIKSDDLVEVERVDSSTIRRGDVVLVRLPRGLTAHRIVHIARDGETLRFVMRGDNTPAEDEPFTESQIVGRVRTPRRWPGWFAMRRVLRRLRAAAR